MDFFSEYLKGLNDRLLNKREIELIYKSLNRYFNSGVQGIKFDTFNNSPIRYDFNSNIVLVDYENALKYFESYTIDCSNNIQIINYLIVFSIIHELFHAKQIIEQDRELVRIYKYCYSLLNDTHHGLSRALTQVIYNKLHDYLAIEVNANIEAYRAILLISEDDIYNYFYNSLIEYINKVYVDYDLVNMYKYLEYKIDKDEFNDMSSETRIKKGVYLSKKINSIDELNIDSLLAVN